MRMYTFTLLGNHENTKGNPVPFQRVLKQKMRPASARYLQWSSWVRGEFYRQCGVKEIALSGKLELARGAPVKIEMHITWADEKHGDADNVFKGIVDALLEEDRHVMDFHVNAVHGLSGRVYTQIQINDDENVIRSFHEAKALARSPRAGKATKRIQAPVGDVPDVGRSEGTQQPRTATKRTATRVWTGGNGSGRGD